MTTRADPLRHLEAELRDLEERSLLRVPPPPRPREATPDAAILLCSNDYLGYASTPWTDPALSSTTDPAPPRELTGAGASRLVAGEHVAHVEAEQEIAAWLGVESALLFSSGYAANVGTLAAVARRGDVILSDALNHASLIDGARLSGAEIVIVPHRDLPAMRAALEHISATRGPAATSRAPSSERPRAVWVVTESYFSMDGDVPDLRALRELCDAHDAALYVDEAHAIGVFGPRGRGLCAEVGVLPDIFIGTFGKALGLQGAFVAGSRTLRRYLWNRARSFVFSTGLSPALTAHLGANIRRAIQDDAARERLHHISTRLRDALRAAGAPITPDSRGPILPWLVGEPAEALALSARLRERGLLVQAIRPPTVPPGTARLRITATANLTEAEVERAVIGLREVAAARR